MSKSTGGFASMSSEYLRQIASRQIASKGGKTAHKRGTAHKWTSEEAAQAGRKGGKANYGRPKGGVMAEKEKMSFREAGRRGGMKSHELGKRHTWASEEAKQAGRKGLQSRWNKAKREGK